MVFGADIIAGFPTESEAMFARSLDLIDDCGLTQLHVFPYSDRPGTEASRMPGRIDGVTVRERARLIREAGQLLSRRFIDRQLGRVHRALVVDDGSCAVTRNGVKVRLGARQHRNEWVAVRLRRAGDAVAGDVVFE